MFSTAESTILQSSAYFIYQGGGSYNAQFTIGGCSYTVIRFSTSDGKIIGTGTPSATPDCDIIPFGAPSEIRLLDTPSIDFPEFYASNFANEPYYECTVEQRVGPNINYRCDDVVTLIPSTQTTTTSATTTTTTTTTTTATATTTTTTVPTPTGTCVIKPNIYGRGNGRGISKDCCKNSDDCYGSCKKGNCDAEHNPSITTSKNTSTASATTSTTSPTSTPPCANKSNVNGQKKGNGVLNDCCRNSADCTGICFNEKCNADGNPSVGGKCTSGNYYGKRNGRGPAGVCCKTEDDCRNSCVVGKCIN
ncbi:unnamed protein product [Mucor hiemalis]